MMTITGIRELAKAFREGRALPQGWLVRADMYIEAKARAVKAFGRGWDREQLREAELTVELVLGGKNEREGG